MGGALDGDLHGPAGPVQGALHDSSRLAPRHHRRRARLKAIPRGHGHAPVIAAVVLAIQIVMATSFEDICSAGPPRSPPRGAGTLWWLTSTARESSSPARPRLRRGRPSLFPRPGRRGRRFAGGHTHGVVGGDAGSYYVLQSTPRPTRVRQDGVVLWEQTTGKNEWDLGHPVHCLLEGDWQRAHHPRCGAHRPGDLPLDGRRCSALHQALFLASRLVGGIGTGPAGTDLQGIFENVLAPDFRQRPGERRSQPSTAPTWPSSTRTRSSTSGPWRLRTSPA